MPPIFATPAAHRELQQKKLKRVRQPKMSLPHIRRAAFQAGNRHLIISGLHNVAGGKGPSFTTLVFQITPQDDMKIQ
jgi:hypothetical protein